jgi:hypothetical protein
VEVHQNRRHRHGLHPEAGIKTGLVGDLAVERTGRRPAPGSIEPFAGSAATPGPTLGAGDTVVAKEDLKVDRMIGSICRGC